MSRPWIDLTPNELEHEPPAYVKGNASDGIAVFIEDARGDLVDIEYYCGYGQCGRGATEGLEILNWPAYQWPDGYSVYCAECGDPINIIEEE